MQALFEKSWRCKLQCHGLFDSCHHWCGWARWDQTGTESAARCIFTYWCPISPLCSLQFSHWLQESEKWHCLMYFFCVQSTVNSLDSGNCRDLELMSSLTRVHNSGSLFQSINVCNSFLPGFSVCPYYQGVRYSGVSARRELTVYDNVGSVMSSMIPFSKMHGSPAFTSQIKENGVFLVVLTPYGSAFSVSVIVIGQQFIWPMS